MQIISKSDIPTEGNGREDYTNSIDASVDRVIRSQQTYVSWSESYRILAYTQPNYYYPADYFREGKFGIFELRVSSLANYSPPTPASGWMIRVGFGYYDTATSIRTEKIRGYGYGEVNQIFPKGVWFDELTDTQYPLITYYNNNPVNIYINLSIHGLLDYQP
jgi:hypothetical protein